MFKVGDKVTLKRDWTAAELSGAFPGEIIPKFGYVYTVRWIGIIQGLPCIRFVEIYNKNPSNPDNETAFTAAFYRKVIEQCKFRTIETFIRDLDKMAMDTQ